MLEATIALILLAGVVWLILTYNRLVRFKHLVKEAWSGIDVQLKRRHSLVPSLVSVVKAYSEYESRTLTQVVAERTSAINNNIDDPVSRSDTENTISRELGKLLAIAEDYPDLKANANFLDLQHNLTEMEEQIQYSRRYYNGTVRNLNVCIDSFPSNLVASLFHFIHAKYFEVELATVREPPDLQL